MSGVAIIQACFFFLPNKSRGCTSLQQLGVVVTLLGSRAGVLRLSLVKYKASLERDRTMDQPQSSPCLDLDDRPQDYERDMQQPDALLQIVHMALCTLLNISVSRKHQVRGKQQ